MSKENSAVKFDRVSSKDQRDGFSLDAQGHGGEKYALDKCLRIVKSWSVDESASKENERRYFFEMVEFIKANNIKHVIFDKVDRACRGFKSAMMIEELIDHYNVRFHFTREHLVIDKDSPPQEKLRFYLGTILGKYYIDNLKVEIKKGQEARRQAGLWSGNAPFGYKNVLEGAVKTVKVDEVAGPVVKEIFELYATGNYPHTHFINLIRQKTGREVSKRTVEDMLANPFHYGDMRVRGQLIKGVHEPLIDKKLWESCQRIRGIRAQERYTKRPHQIPKPFMGFMTCGACGHQVTGEAKSKSSGKSYVYYHCAHPRCPERKVNASQDEIFDQVVKAFEPFARFTPKATKAFIENLHGRLQELDWYTQKKTGELAEKRTEIKRNIEKLELLHKKGVLTAAEYQEVLRVKEETLVENKIEIDAHNEADHKTFKEGLRVIELFVSVWNFMQKGGNELEKVRLAKLVLSNPVLECRTLRFQYQKPFDILLENAGSHY